ncbi:SET domain-containing protein [Cucurbitaria berberidis CBS 394.84]|uniref:SET domain-containing protein n=1 Tax=Cucurbitaria berberidis CBS 394.84 TaxID=1168544 RepID=A0A9P4GJN7_9PLEO|nr:SET domain-containing protein [Cucurbitaria berberidis CBS 394.84]KAF1846674.1 SET domain-containing protein [Cucurbitaria berberidis CBS 394.84]
MSSIQSLVALLGLSIFTSCTQASLQCATSDYNALTQPQALLCLDDDNAPGGPPSLRVKNGKWSQEPFCVAGQAKTYCTHTTSDFRNGHGVSVIASREAANAISSAFPASKAARYISEERLEVSRIPGKGKGLITRHSIQRGDTILLDSPRIIASAQFPSHVSPSQGASLFSTILDQLPGTDRDLLLSLDKSISGTDIENVMKTNAFACQPDDGEVGDGYMCLFPSVSRINHACRPNAHARFIPKSLLMEIKAVRDIEAGEEISISYGRIDLKHAERQRLYKEGWNFTCTCNSCTSTAYEIAGSDQRRARFEQLRKLLENITSETYDAQQIVAWEKEVMEISAREGLDMLLAGDYERLAYVYAGHGMNRDAKIWATKAKESLMEWTVVDGGPGNEIRRVEDFLGELGG